MKMEALAGMTPNKVEDVEVQVHYHLTPYGCHAVIMSPMTEKTTLVTTTDDVE